MNQKIWKVGLLGAGYIFDAHAKALTANPNVKMVAVCDRSIERAQKAAATYGIQFVFTDLHAMLASKVDAVHVLLPPEMHVDATRQILLSGRHAFVEKPMGLDSTQCQQLADLAKQNGVRLAVNHNFLFLPSYEALRQQARDGTLGDIDQITINWLYPLGLVKSGPFGNWMLQKPQNLMFELGPHLVAFVIDLAGVPDRLDTDVFRPIVLPGGSTVYRRWHIHAQKGNAAIDLNLSVLPGHADRSISVRALAANAKCDFERDIYLRDEPSGSTLLFDNFLSTTRVAWQMWRHAGGNLLKSLINTVRKRPAANPFGESIERSIAAFYASLEGQADSRHDAQFGVNVVATCEDIVRCIAGQVPDVIGQAPDVLPPVGKPNVLVLGGTGFIGKYLVRKLVSSGYGVRVVARDMASARIAFEGLAVELICGDIASADVIDPALDGIDVVFYLAKADGKRWEDYYQKDVLVTKRVAEMALAKGIKRFIYTGTIDSHYSANSSDVITAETPLDQKIVLRNHYARSKAACEALLLDMYRRDGLPLVILRPGVVIGKGCPPAHWGVGMFQSDTCVQFWGDGSTKLPLVLVEDVAEALLLAMKTPDIEGRTFLLTDKPLLSATEYVEAVSMASGTRLRAKPQPIWKYFLLDVAKEAIKHAVKHPNRKIPSYRDWDSRSHRARYDSSSTSQALGWNPAGSREALIDKGIKTAVAEFMR